MFHKTVPPNSRLHSTFPQFQSPLKLINTLSKHTPAESLPQDAEPTLITESSPSDMELKMGKTTSSLKTHGELHGEIKDTSKSDKTTSAVSSWLLHMLLNDQCNIYLIYLIYLHYNK